VFCSVCCSVLQCAACVAGYQTAVRRPERRSLLVCCSVLRCSLVQCVAVRCSVFLLVCTTLYYRETAINRLGLCVNTMHLILLHSFYDTTRRCGKERGGRERFLQFSLATATLCNTLLFTATHCNALQLIACRCGKERGKCGNF